jgi:hypothetical protein
VAVAVVDPTLSGPHILHFLTSEVEPTAGLLFLEDVKGTREGVDIRMLRGNANGLLYATDGQYGLPLIIDPTIGVIGQTGQRWGHLADSYSLAFAKTAFGGRSKVAFKEDLPTTLVAGNKYPYSVTLYDADRNPVQAETLLTGWVEGGQESAFETRLLDGSITRQEGGDGNVYTGNLDVTEVGRWTFFVTLVRSIPAKIKQEQTDHTHSLTFSLSRSRG